MPLVNDLDTIPECEQREYDQSEVYLGGWFTRRTGFDILPTPMLCPWDYVVVDAGRVLGILETQTRNQRWESLRRPVWISAGKLRACRIEAKRIGGSFFYVQAQTKDCPVEAAPLLIAKNTPPQPIVRYYSHVTGGKRRIVPGTDTRGSLHAIDGSGYSRLKVEEKEAWSLSLFRTVFQNPPPRPCTRRKQH